MASTACPAAMDCSWPRYADAASNVEVACGVTARLNDENILAACSLQVPRQLPPCYLARIRSGVSTACEGPTGVI